MSVVHAAQSEPLFLLRLLLCNLFVMRNAPQFQTAIPKRRYRIGAFEAVVLGDIESKDSKRYIYIFALVRDGDGDPCLYVVLERSQTGKNEIVVIAEEQLKQFEANDALTDIETFAEAAIDAAVRLFRLSDEEPYRML